MASKIDVLKARMGALKGYAEIFLGPTDIIGVDVGSYAIKVVLLKQEGPVWSLKSWGHLPIVTKPEATPEEKKTATINALRAFLIQKGIKIKEVATALSGNAVIVRYVKFPRLTKSELQSTLATEAEP